MWRHVAPTRAVANDLLTNGVQTGDSTMNEVLDSGEDHLYSVKSFRLLTRATGVKGQPIDKDEFEQTINQNLAIIGKAVDWSGGSLTSLQGKRVADSDTPWGRNDTRDIPSSAKDASDDESVEQQLKAEEKMDITALGGYRATTLGNAE